MQPATEREQTAAPKPALRPITHKHNQPSNTIRRSIEVPVMFLRGVDVKPHGMIKLATLKARKRPWQNSKPILFGGFNKGNDDNGRWETRANAELSV